MYFMLLVCGPSSREALFRGAFNHVNSACNHTIDLLHCFTNAIFNSNMSQKPHVLAYGCIQSKNAVLKGAAHKSFKTLGYFCNAANPKHPSQIKNRVQIDPIND